MPQLTTTNALDDFDLCLALSQMSINSQLRAGWAAWKARKQMPDTFDLLITKRGNDVVPAKLGLKGVKVAPLKVSLAVPDAMRNQVRVHLRLESGTVLYFDEEKGAAAEYPVKDWEISFITNLEKQAVDLQALKQIDPKGHETTQAMIKTSGLPDSVFSIEYLFVKLTNLQLRGPGNAQTQMPADVPRDASNKALDVIDLWFDKQVGSFLLGTVVHRNMKQATPTFAMTDFVFSIRGHDKVADASTLNYLGEFSGRALPSDINGARDKLKDAWLKPEQINGQESNVAGVMAIGRAIFLEKYLLPKVAWALFTFNFPKMLNVGHGYQGGVTPPVPPRKGLTWTFSREEQERDSANRFLVERTVATGGYSVDFTVKPSTNQISIGGRVSTKVHFDAGFSSTDRTEWAYTEGHRDLTGSFSLTGNGIGTEFNLQSTLAFNLGEPLVDKNELGGAVKINEAWKALKFIPATPEELVRNKGQEILNALNNAMKDSLSQLALDLSQHTFIPPGGGVFTYQNPRFSNAGDLFFDVIYRAP
jgi:hypothetical protein